ncbi:MAG: HEAT repeat domain-containing protein [Acidobacteriota bacterium]
MKVMLSCLTVFLVVGSLNQTVSGTAQEDAKLAAILDRISNTSQQGKEIVEKIKDLKPEVNGQPSAMTLGAKVKDYWETAHIHIPIGWEASQKMNGRWKIILHYQYVQKQYVEAEWEYNPATSKLYPFEVQNAPQFWAPGCQPLDSTDPNQLYARMNECVRPEGAKRTRQPSLSPSGDRYVFVGEFWERWNSDRPPLSGEKSDLWMVNINGTGLQRLTTDGTSYDPEWSPDGNEIVFTDKGSIKVLDTRSKEVRTLLDAHSVSPDEGADSVVYNQPKWSPSGKAIAVVALGSCSGGRESIDQVEVITTNGSAVCRFANGAEHHQWNKKGELELDYGKFIFDWDGFIFSDKPQPEREVKPASDKADQLRKELLERVNAYGVERIAEYSLAPSGNRIVFAGEFEGNMAYGSGSRGDLWLVNRDGTGLRRLTENHYSSQPAWSPSGKEIAFVNNGDVKVIDVKTRNIRSLPELLAYHPKPEHRTHDHWDLVYLQPRWSPNGKVIAAQRWDDLSDGAMTAVEARSGNAIFETEPDRGSSFSWNHEGELVVEHIGKFVFDWDRTFWYGSWPRNHEPAESEQDGLAEPAADAVVATLLHALSDSDKGVRSSSASALKSAPALPAIAGLIVALQDPEASVRRNAAGALARRDAGDAVPRLIQLMRDPDNEVRSAARNALGAIGPGKAAAALAGALKHQDGNIRVGATLILYNFGLYPKALIALVEALKDQDASVRSTALLSILSFAKGPDWKSAIPALIEALENADQRVRYRAALALSGVKPGEQRYPDFGQLPESVIPILPGPVIPILMDALKDQDPAVRSQAAWALAGIGPAAKAAVPALIESIEDRNLEVCRYATYALKNVGGKSAAIIPALIKLLKHPDGGIRESATEALVNIGAPAVPPLVRLLMGQDSTLRVMSYYALLSIGDVFALVATLKSRDKHLRSLVLEAIEDIRVDPARSMQAPDLLFDPSRKYLFHTVRIPCTYEGDGRAIFVSELDTGTSFPILASSGGLSASVFIESGGRYYLVIDESGGEADCSTGSFWLYDFKANEFVIHAEGGIGGTERGVFPLIYCEGDKATRVGTVTMKNLLNRERPLRLLPRPMHGLTLRKNTKAFDTCDQIVIIRNAGTRVLLTGKREDGSYELYYKGAIATVPKGSLKTTK